MTVDTIESALIGVLGEIQECSGRPAWPMSGSTRPIGDLEGFDSLNIAEAATLLSGALGRKIDYKLLLPTRRHQSLSIRDIAQAVHHTIETAEGTKDRL